MTTFPTVFEQIQDEVRKTLVDLKHPDPTPSQLFGVPAKVFFQGDSLDTTDLDEKAVADVAFSEEGSDRVGTKITQTLDVVVRVYFGSDTITGASESTWHAKLLGLVKDAFMADPSLGGKAIDVAYTGSGSFLQPEDTEEQPDRWSFTVRFRIQYRHRDTDSGVQV